MNHFAKRIRQKKSGIIKKSQSFSFWGKIGSFFGKMIELLRPYSIHESVIVVVILFTILGFFVSGNVIAGGAAGSDSVVNINSEDLKKIIASINVYAITPADLEMTNQSLILPTVDDNFIIKPSSSNTIASTLVRDKIISHTVEDGETLWTIAYKYELNLDTIRWANNISDPNSIAIGQKILIPPVNGLLYQVRAGDTVARIASLFGVGTDGIEKYNHLDEKGLVAGETIVVPGARPMASPRYAYYSSKTAAYDGPIATGSGSFFWPTTSSIHYITQYFLWGHTGIDLDWRNGVDIKASDGGTVVATNYGWGGGYGNHIIIDHGNGYQTLYAHLLSIAVSVGDNVSKGQSIGVMGSTGRSTGRHLHFEIRQDGRPLNPLAFLSR